MGGEREKEERDGRDISRSRKRILKSKSGEWRGRRNTTGERRERGRRREGERVERRGKREMVAGWRKIFCPKSPNRVMHFCDQHPTPNQI